MWMREEKTLIHVRFSIFQDKSHGKCSNSRFEQVEKTIEKTTSLNKPLDGKIFHFFFWFVFFFAHFAQCRESKSLKLKLKSVYFFASYCYIFVSVLSALCTRAFERARDEQTHRYIVDIFLNKVLPFRSLTGEPKR